MGENTAKAVKVGMKKDQSNLHEVEGDSHYPKRSVPALKQKRWVSGELAGVKRKRGVQKLRIAKG